MKSIFSHKYCSEKLFDNKKTKINFIKENNFLLKNRIDNILFQFLNILLAWVEIFIKILIIKSQLFTAQKSWLCFKSIDRRFGLRIIEGDY